MIDKNRRQRLKLCNMLRASSIKKRCVIDFFGGWHHIFHSTNALAPELWPVLNRCEKLQTKRKRENTF